MVGVKVESIRNSISFNSLRARSRRGVVFTVLFVLFGLPQVSFATNPELLKIGFMPGEASSDLKSRGDDFAKLVEKRIGRKVQIFVAASPSDLITALRDKKIDFAFMSSLTFVEAEKQTKLKVLLKKVWDQGFYYSALIVKKGSTIRKISDLKGRRIAFVDAKSASGYLYPQVFFKESGFDVQHEAKQVVFSGSHEQSVELLRSGQVDAIAVFSNKKDGQDSAWTQLKGRHQDIRVIWSSAAIPNDPFCVREDFYEHSPKAVHDLMFGFIEMTEDAVLGAEAKKWLGARGLMLATSQQYEPVREMFRTLKKAEAAP